MKPSTWIIIFLSWLVIENIAIKLNDIRDTLQMCEESVPYDIERQRRIDGEIRGDFNNF